MNHITIEWCAEDRARIDRLIELLDRKNCDKCVETVLSAVHATQNPPAASAAVQPPISTQPAPAVPVEAPVPTPTSLPPAPVATPAPAPAVLPAQPASAVPVGGAPAYSLEMIARAGAEFVDRNPAVNIASLQQLMVKYGVPAITYLQPAQYGAFATDLRALGANI